MTTSIREGVVIGLCALLIGTLHTFFHQNTIAFVIPLIVLSNLCTWTLRTPGYALVVLCIIGELFSITPPGLITLVALIPLGFKRIRPATTVDLSFTFLVTLSATSLLQLFLLLSPLLITESLEVWQPLLTLPQLPILWSFLATLAVTFILSLFAQSLLPRDLHRNTLIHARRRR